MSDLNQKTKLERPKAKANEPSTDAPHDPNRFQRAERTYLEAKEQGQVLRAALTSQAQSLVALAEQLAALPFTRLQILGCGDSWFAGMGVRYALEYLLGMPVEALQALDYALYYAQTSASNSLVIGISSGGNTPAVMEGLRAAQEAGAVTVGASNKAGTPVLTEFQFGLFVPATRSGWPTQASTTTMGLLLRLGLEIARRRATRSPAELDAFEASLQALPDMMDEVLQQADAPIHSLAASLAEARFLFFCAGGPHLAAAAFGAAKVKELCPIHAEVIPLEEFHHYRTLKPGDPLFLLAPDSASHPRALDTAEVGRYDGGRIFALVPTGEKAIASVAEWSFTLPEVDARLAPVIYSLPLHLFAYHLSIEKFNRGLGFTPAFPQQG